MSIPAHDLLQGLALQAAVSISLGDIAFAQGKHVPDIDGIEGLQVALFGLLVGQVRTPAGWQVYHLQSQHAPLTKHRIFE